MPAVNQGGGVTLTFSKKNEDVKDILDKKRKEKKIKITDYICECIRFYENSDRHNINDISEDKIKDIVEKHMIDILNNSNISIPVKSNHEIDSLEDNLDDIDIDEDD